MTYHTKTPASKAGTEAASNGGMNRDKLIMRHTNTCLAQMSLDQALSCLHKLGLTAEYESVAAVWVRVGAERRDCSERLFPEAKRKGIAK